MPKVIQEEEFTPVLAAFAGVAEALSLEQVSTRLAAALPRRTLQRRLALLVARGRLSATSTRGGRRYRLPDLDRPAARGPVAAVEEDPPTPTDAPEGVIPLSPAAREIRALVTRPIAQRTPVGYRAEFLNSYQPNVTAYLPAALREDLARLGRVSAGPLPAGTYFRKVMDRLLIDLAWNSSRLEGNTYSLLETQRLLALGESAAGKQAHEARMILNHKAAIELLDEQADEIGFNRYTLLNLHALLADSLLPEGKAGGRLRDEPVGIGGSVYLPLAVPQLVEEQFNRLLATAEAIRDPFEQSFFSLVHLPYLQPFDDVNKRVSRLAANIPLVRHNLCPLSFVDLPQADYVGGLLGVYELNRIDYLRDVYAWAYARSCQRYGAVRATLGQPDPFRLKYRDAAGRLVAEVVRARLDKLAAARRVAAEAAAVPEEDRARFVTLTESELSELHEGNIARFRLRPSEYYAWKAGWR